MSTYRREVEGLLGKECVTKLCYHVMGGKMSEDELKYFVQHLGELSNTNSEAPNVLYGNHLRRMRRYDRRYDLELLEVLSDWWAESLFERVDNGYKELEVRKSHRHASTGFQRTYRTQDHRHVINLI